METLHPSLIASHPNWFSQRTEWTKEENKRFESALAIYDEHEPDRWLKVAAMIPGKTVYDVIKQYKELVEDVSEIEAGRFPFPGYLSSSFALEFIDERDFDSYRKRPNLMAKNPDHERKKGVPWTEDEHRRFLLGLLKHGKGDWRNISRNFVVSKTPTQVASHAQKYFIRQQFSGIKEKRRPSIHDITTVNLTNTSLSESKTQPSTDNSNYLQQKSTTTKEKVLIDWNQPKNESIMVFDSDRGNLSVSYPYEIASNLVSGAYNQGESSNYNLVFHKSSINASRHRI